MIRHIVVASMLLGGSLAGSSAGAEEADGRRSHLPLIIERGYVGVAPTRAPDPLTNTITWLGDPASGEIEVLWTSLPPRALQSAAGRPLIPRYVGALNAEEVAGLRDDLSQGQAVATAWGGGIVVCSLHVANPYWNSSPSQARGGVAQACNNHSQHRVTEVLLKQVGLSFTAMDSDDTGWRTTGFINALGVAACAGTTPRAWINVGQGEAIRNGVHFSGPTEAAARTLGCG